MHPIKILEKNWVDSYKFAKLLEQQERRLTEQHIGSLFGGVSEAKLGSAFSRIRCNSSAGYRSPKGGAASVTRGSVARSLQMFNTMQGPQSSQHYMNDFNSTMEGDREPK